MQAAFNSLSDQSVDLVCPDMVLPKSKNAAGLGNSLMNDRFGKGKGSERKKVSAGIRRTDQNGQTVSLAIPEYFYLKLTPAVCHKRQERGCMGQDAQCNGARCT